MSKYIKIVNRIIDANINRAKEGLRVCEEISRFILNSRTQTTQLKEIRHKINSIIKSSCGQHFTLIRERQSLSDVGRDIYGNELKRKNIADIFFANIQRAKESVRVLEEFSKLKDRAMAVKFKKVRYKIYALEKKIAQQIANLCAR